MIVESKEPLTLPKLERARVQNRFQPRLKRLSVKGSSGLHIRDDYYESYTFGLGLEYFVTDHWGVGLHYTKLLTLLSDEATLLRDQYGLVPDAEAQDQMFTISALYGFGYGKMLLADQIVHFDPIVSAHLGVTTALQRVLPTLKFGFSPTVLFLHGLSATLDLGFTIQLEERTRGWVMTTGFMPSLSVAWGTVLKPRLLP